MSLEYYKSEEIDRGKFLAAIEDGESLPLREAMISAAFHIDDWKWLQGQYVELLGHDDPWVRKVAATCLAHVARIHRRLDVAVVRPLIEALLDDPETRGHAEDALEDIEDVMLVDGSAG
ncbi:hypothetical protein [Promicromonospora umidemergens]|uniref:HEAT repeat protein n=1 Tax=Promicromonospora umidemergens TaxID=629679 RepID=A0ABP8XKS0_9MICO|nr:hypothetical protein [Promicromonospora umidemergens]